VPVSKDIHQHDATRRTISRFLAAIIKHRETDTAMQGSKTRGSRKTEQRI
jgi:hypothetical protein